jgi:hypothetical protein
MGHTVHHIGTITHLLCSYIDHRWPHSIVFFVIRFPVVLAKQACSRASSAAGSSASTCADQAAFIGPSMQSKVPSAFGLHMRPIQLTLCTVLCRLFSWLSESGRSSSAQASRSLPAARSAQPLQLPLTAQ